MTSVAMAFDRPVGVRRDIAEMEFITALLQTQKGFLRNRVTVEDISIYLRSRHGIAVPEEEVRELLVHEMAGATCDNSEHDSIDPCQMAAVLLIPQLLQAAQGGRQNVARVFEAFNQEFGTGSKNQVTVEGLRAILRKNGEDCISDNVLREMVATLNSNGGDIVKTLTDDLALFQLEWEGKHSTHLEDALGSSADVKNLGSEQATNNSKGNNRSLTRIGTASFIDYSADNFRRPLFHALLLGCGIAGYFSYVLNIEYEWLTCDTSKLPCQVGKGLVGWLTIFMQLVILGLPLILLGSFGNSVRSTNPAAYVARLLIAIATIAMFTIYPYYTEMDTKFFYTGGNKDLTYEEYCTNDDDSTSSSSSSSSSYFDNCMEYCTANPSECDLGYDVKTDVYGAAYWLSLILGGILISFLVVDLLYFFIPKSWLQNSIFGSLVTPGGIRQEAAAKKAASYRMSQMLGNALNLQSNQIGNNADKSVLRVLKRMRPNASVMERFLMLPKVTEEAGGVVWVWKRIFNGTLFSEEGVWITGRVLACNFAQLMVLGMVIFFTLFWKNQEDTFLYTKQETAAMKAVRESRLSNTVLRYGNYQLCSLYVHLLEG